MVLDGIESVSLAGVTASLSGATLTFNSANYAYFGKTFTHKIEVKSIVFLTFRLSMTVVLKPLVGQNFQPQIN